MLSTALIKSASPYDKVEKLKLAFLLILFNRPKFK
jgi:hypothetical protein